MPNSPCLAKSAHKKGERCNRSKKNAPHIGIKLPTTFEKAQREASLQCFGAQSRIDLMIEVRFKTRSKNSAGTLMIRSNFPQNYPGGNHRNISPFASKSQLIL